MLNPNLYEPIFQRKSIRSYDDAPLTPDQLSFIKAEIGSVVPLLPAERFHLELGEAREGWRVYGYCENTPLSNANLGFAMQQLDLALHLQGLGRLWFGMGRDPGGAKPPKGQGLSGKGLSYAMCLKVGGAAEPLSRESAEEFKRKPIGEVVEGEGLYELFEAVRLAPSARNSQPWYFAQGEGAIQAWRKQPGLIGKLIIDRMNWIDMGIALCHAVLALEHAGKPFEIEIAPPAQSREGYDYLLDIAMPN